MIITKLVRKTLFKKSTNIYNIIKENIIDKRKKKRKYESMFFDRDIVKDFFLVLNEENTDFIYRVWRVHVTAPSLKM